MVASQMSLSAVNSGLLASSQMINLDEFNAKKDLHRARLVKALAASGNTNSQQNTRLHRRLPFKMTLKIAFEEGSWVNVQTLDVSQYGAKIESEMEFKEGQKLVVIGLKGQFVARTIVRHVKRSKNNDCWEVGLDFTAKSGKWIVADDNSQANHPITI